MTDFDITTAEAGPQEIMVVVRDNPGIVLLDQQRFEEFYERIKAETEKLDVDLTTQKGRDAIASMAFKVAKTKTAIDAAGKVLKEDAQATVTKVDAARKLIRDRLDALKDEVRKPLTEWEEAEAARVQSVETVLATVRAWANVTTEETSADIQSRIGEARSIEFAPDTFRDREGEAALTRDSTILALERALERIKREEDDRAELDRLRAEAQARIEAEAEAQAKASAEADAKRAAEAEAAREAEIAKRAEDAARAAAEAKANAERVAVERAHSDALATEKRRADEAEAAARAERARAEAEARATAEREADRAHRGKVMGDAKAAIMAFGVTEKVAKAIVLAIKADEIPNVSIRF